MSPSNLAYILEIAWDVGERLPSKEAIRRKAGFLLHNLISMHPFLDGNKRTAFETMKNFLRLNGWSFDPPEEDSFRVLLSIAKGEMTTKSVESWVGKHLRRARHQK